MVVAVDRNTAADAQFGASSDPSVVATAERQVLDEIRAAVMASAAMQPPQPSDDDNG